MKDLTEGSIPRHLIHLAVVMGFGMLAQNLYFLIDLYFVATLGRDAVAGVGSAGNAVYIVHSLGQALGVGTLALVAHAAGRKDKVEANLIANRALALSAACAVGVLILGYCGGANYLQSMAADEGSKAAGTTYLYWYLPALALQFLVGSMISTMRGTGIARPTMTAQLVSVGVNIVFAPILIAGWGTGHPLGVAGAAMASCIAVATSAAMLARHFLKPDAFVKFHASLWRPDWVVWRKILTLGGPAGGELAFTFICISVVYWAIRDFGAAAQAGFGIALRITQSLYLPAFAVAFAATPVGGQNFGARYSDRVRETFRSAAIIVAALMAGLTLLCQIAPAGLMRIFSTDPEVVAIGATFLRIVSWNLVPYGLIWTCSGLFQALGNTLPSFISMASRILTFAIPVAVLSFYSGFKIEQIWYLWVASVALQCVISFVLLRAQFRSKLPRMSYATP